MPSICAPPSTSKLPTPRFSSSVTIPAAVIEPSVEITSATPFSSGISIGENT